MYRTTALTALILTILAAGFFGVSPTFGVDPEPIRTAMLPRAHAATPESQPFSQGKPAVGVYLLGLRVGLRASEPFREVEPAAGAADGLVFSAPPRETPAEGARLYQPLADYLSQALGRRVTYRHPGTWGVYRTEVLQGKYDLVFDDPHLTSYHAEKHGYHSIVRFSEHFQYAVVVRSDYVFKSVARLRGQTFCTFAPPNLGTLVLLSLFDNPARQPVLLSVNSWEQAYQGVVGGQCVGGVIPLPMARKLDPTIAGSGSCSTARNSRTRRCRPGRGCRPRNATSSAPRWWGPGPPNRRRNCARNGTPPTGLSPRPTRNTPVFPTI